MLFINCYNKFNLKKTNMTKFEEVLIEKGYLKHFFNTKTKEYERTDKHLISTMGNLAYFYINKKNDIICFGLHEGKKPPTLIYPRPKINIKRNCLKQNKIIIEDEYFDDSMNIVLRQEAPEKIFNSLFDNSICFNYDLTT